MARLRRLLELARGYYEEFVETLHGYEREGERTYLYAAERLAQLIAQAILDFAAVLASRETGVKPGTYRELARWLARRARLSGELVSFLEGLAGFRNVLVHMYAEIDAELEMRAFREIAEKTPVLLERLEEFAGGDPCLEDVKPRIERVARKLRLRYVLVFGSLARRGCGRDVDLAVKLGRKPESLLEIGRLQVIFEDEVGAPVDLVVIDAGVPPALAKTLVDEAILVYGDREEADRDLLRLYKLYLDYVEATRETGRPQRSPGRA